MAQGVDSEYIVCRSQGAASDSALVFPHMFLLTSLDRTASYKASLECLIKPPDTLLKIAA